MEGKKTYLMTFFKETWFHENLAFLFQVLKCSAHLPLWDHRAAGRSELKVPEGNSLESEIKITSWIKNKYYKDSAELSKKLEPYVTFQAATHWIRNQESICVHLNIEKSKRKDGGKSVLDIIVRLMIAILQQELKTALKSESHNAAS